MATTHSDNVHTDNEQDHLRSLAPLCPLFHNKLVLQESKDLREQIKGVHAESQEDIDVSSTRDVNEFVRLEDFVKIKVIGVGSFGKVYQAWKKGTMFELYAMKVLRKDKMIKKDVVEDVISERNILTKLDHTFIIHLRYSFQTKYRLYLIFDFISGGSLHFHLSRQFLFREDLARVFAAEIVSALSYLHANYIMHRDIKAENILLDVEGHIVLTDFGFATQFHSSKITYDECGTVEYMAPEVFLDNGYDKAADWWSFGILLFEMLTGEVPFPTVRGQSTVKKILRGKFKMPGYLTTEAHSLLKGLLQKEPSKRLGSGQTGIEEIKGHRWFKPINWKKLEAREIKPSFNPVKTGIMCTANFDKKWENRPLRESYATAPTVPELESFEGFPFATAPPLTKEQSEPTIALTPLELQSPGSRNILG